MMASKRVSAKDRVKDSVFNSTEAVKQDHLHIDNETSKHVNNEISKQDDNETSKQNDIFKRQTYYLSEEIIQAIALKSAIEKKDKSEIVRDALKAFIEDKYFNFKIDR